MSSNSTATKLSRLVGLEGAKRAVLRIAAGEAGTHAVLLYGSEGAGKTELANALAQAWLCTSPGPEGACGECGACQAFDRGSSADLLAIRPARPSNIIRVPAFVRPKNPTQKDVEDYPTALLDFLRTPPLRARHKVAVVFDADRLNYQAANAFLKTLEEPEPHTRIVLTSSRVGGVTPTILSRCLAVACELPPSDPSDEFASILAEGAPGRLHLVREHAEAYERISAIARALPTEPPERALAISEEFRQACTALGESSDAAARAAYVEGLRALGTCVAAQTRQDAWMSAIAEAHRRVQMNGSAGIVLDAMFSRLLLMR